MGVLDTLDNLKGKALDLAHVEALKHAYQVQEENIKQLKTNNDTFKDQCSLLREAKVRLEKEVTNLRTKVARLREKNRELKAKQVDTQGAEMVELDIQILKFLSKCNGEHINVSDMEPNFRVKRTLLEHHLSKLSRLSHIIPSHSLGSAVSYCIGAGGRAYLINNNLLDA